jgi:hypothetical protein
VDETEQALIDALVEQAQEPRRTESDGQSAEGRDLRELVAALSAVQATNSAAAGRTGVKLRRVVPPGAGPT